MTKIKICGIRREEDIAAVNELLPDYIGYVFAKSSGRYITPEAALRLTSLLDKRIIPVGVFVNEPIEAVLSLVKSGAIRAVQLHGSESDEYVRRLKSEGVTVIRAFKVDASFDASAAEKSSADHILLDSGSGSGKTFDHSAVKEFGRVYFLAGGLGAENASEAIRELHPFGVDASSLLETDGFKDPDKMRKFVNAVRNINI